VRESRVSSIKPGAEDELSFRRRGQADAPGMRVERLYYDYAGLIYRYCLSRLDSPEDADDALQATYLNAWRSIDSGVEPLSSRPWLFQIAANVCSSMLRTRLGGASVQPFSPEELDRIPTKVEPNDDLLGLSAALAGLPERQRHALLLRDWRGLSYDEIAAELDSSYQAVETLLFRARKSVAARLRSPESTAVPARARALAPLPFLLLFKDGLASIKASLGASVAPIKVSLVIALGATAPLVVYGVLEGSGAHIPRAHQATAPVVNVEAPLTFVTPRPEGKKTVDTAAPRAHPQPGPNGTHEESSSHETGSGIATATDGGAGSSDQEGGEGEPVPTPDPVAPTPDPVAPTPDPVSSPPPDEGQPPPDKVVICHQTNSKKNPSVTITVAESAVQAFLAQGDKLGYCAS
jgi:RNA polymerase sigma-70 factor (ECF subfamily)